MHSATMPERPSDTPQTPVTTPATRPTWRARVGAWLDAVHGAVLVLWAIAAIGVAALRWLPFQAPLPWSAIEAEARWVVPLALLGLVLAWRRGARRTALALAAASLFLIVWSLEWLPVALGHDASRTSTLRVLSSNVLAPRPDVALAQQIRDADADVVLLQEVSDPWWALLAAQGVLERYPHHVFDVHPLEQDYMGIAILSRLPIERGGIEALGGTHVPYAWAEVRTDDGVLVRVRCIHTSPPYGDALLAGHLAQMAHLRHMVRADLADPAIDAVVIGGDLNASPMSRQYRLLRQSGVTSAHERVGRGFATTWPNVDVVPVPVPPMRLDHVFYGGDDVEAVSVREGDGHRSDHLPVFVELSLARRSPGHHAP